MVTSSLIQTKGGKMKKLEKHGEKRDDQSRERQEREKDPYKKEEKGKKPRKRKIFFKWERVSFLSRSCKF